MERKCHYLGPMHTGQTLEKTGSSPHQVATLDSSVDPRLRETACARPRLLTAEDDADLRTVMQAILELHGYHVTACVNGEDAEAVYLEQQPFDLLVTDLEMPGKSGAELASSLCETNPSLPVLIVSGANIDARQLQEFRSKGWTFVSKPFVVPNLIHQISTLLARSGISDSIV